MQAGGRLVQDVEGLAGLALLQLAGELHALGLAAGERGRRLAQADVAEAHVEERLQLALDARDVLEEVQGVLDGHVEHLGDVLAAVGHLQRLAVVALAVADLAGHVDVGEEVHLDLDLAVALAGLAAAAAHVEGEAPRRVAAGLGLGRAGEQRADVVPQSDVGGRVRARGAPDGALVDVDDLVQLLQARDLAVGPGAAMGVVQPVGERRRQRVGDKGALAGAGDARDHGERADGHLQRDVLQVVLLGAGHLQRAAARLAASLRHRDAAAPRQIVGRDGALRGHDLRRRPRRDDVASVLAGARAHVHHEVGRPDGVLVVLHDHHGVAQVSQALQRGDEPLVVALVKPDGGLVQNVEHAHEPGADLGGEPDALGLAAGERGRGPLQREVVQAHVHEEAQPLADLLHDGQGDDRRLAREVQPLEERQRLGRRHLRDVVDGLVVHRDREDLRLQALAAAGLAGHRGEIGRQLLALGVGLGLGIAALHRGEHALPLDVPVGVAAVHGAVVHAHLLVAEAVQERLLGLLRHVLPRCVGVGAHMLGHGAQHLGVVVAALERRDDALVQREGRIRYHERGVHLVAAADAEAVGAGAVGGVEGEVTGLQLVHGVAVLGAREGQREQMLSLPEAARGARGGAPGLAERFPVRPEHLHEHAALRQLAGQLHGIGDAALGRFLQRDAVDHHVDEVLDLLVQGDGLTGKLHDLAVDAHAGEALLLQIGEELRELALAAGHHRGHEDGLRRLALGVVAEAQDIVGHLVGGLLLDLAAALGAVGHAHAREQKAQVVVDLGGSAHGGAGVFRRGLLIDGHRRRQAVDGVHVGLGHLAQEHAGIAGETLHIAALPLGVHGVEGEAGLAGAGKARDDDQLVAGNSQVDVLQVVLAGAFDDDLVGHWLDFLRRREATGAARAARCRILLFRLRILPIRAAAG